MKLIDRRTLLRRSIVTGLAIGASPLGARLACADPDVPLKSQTANTAEYKGVPEIYAFKIGALEAWVIHDGMFSVPAGQAGAPSGGFIPEASAAQIKEASEALFLPADHYALSINVLVLKSVAGVVLVDAGSGAAFGPVAGHLRAGLAALKIDPSEVTSVLVTHAHADHIAGLFSTDGGLTFPNARILISKTEAEFWLNAAPDLSKLRLPAEERLKLHSMVKNLLERVGSKLERVGHGEILPGIQMLPAAGHTPGHSVIMITSEKESLLHLGDAVHVYSLQFTHPELSMIYDTVPAQASATRQALFKKVSAERRMVMGYHMPFPGLGHLRSAGKGYEWIPRPWVL